MDRNNLVNSTKSLYQLTLLFPKKEPLRYKMRELAVDILANFVKVENHSTIDETDQLIDDLEIIDSYFTIADVQNWVTQAKLLPVWDDYLNIKECILEKKKNFEVPLPEINVERKRKETVVRPSSRQDLPNARHGKILEFLKENGQAQVQGFKNVFPDVTKRTLRRDFRFLLKQGAVERVGERNNTFYKIKSQDEPVALLS